MAPYFGMFSLLCFCTIFSQKKPKLQRIVAGLIMVGENAEGDEFGIGNDQSYSILEVARLFGGEIEMLPERRGNRRAAEVMTEKTKELRWECRYDLEGYIKNMCDSIKIQSLI